MAEVTPDSIFQIASGFMAAKHLFVANEVGLFAQLAEGSATLDDLTPRLGLPRRTTRMVADAMVALGLVQREGDHYQNSPVAAAFLSGRTSTDVRPILRQFNRLSYPRWAHLEEAVRTGKAVFGEFAFSAEEQQIYSEGVEAITAGTAQALATRYDFSRHRRVLDLGGGTGSFLVAILQQHPPWRAPSLICLQWRQLHAAVWPPPHWRRTCGLSRATFFRTTFLRIMTPS